MPRKKENNMDKTNTGTPVRPKNRLFIIIICSILAALLIFGAVMGIILAVREATAAVSYNGVTFNEGVTAYLASTFKAGYNGDDLAGDTEKYLRAMAVAVYLYDRNSALSSSDKEWIQTNVGEILDYRAENSVKIFNELASGMGFTYDDFKAATEIIYKAVNSKVAIYGEGGKNLASESGIGSLNDYFKEYSHVKILFVRTEDKFVLDEAGNRVRGEDGNDKTVKLTDTERAAVAADIAAINAAIADGTMTPEIFTEYYKSYNDDAANASGGYYFAANSEFTVEYSEAYPALIDKVLSMSVGEFGSSVDGETVCFIYKYENTALDYANSARSHFFGDFYSDAADYLYNKALEELSGGVNLKDRFYAIDLDGLKRNSLFRTALGVGINVR